MPNSLPFHSRAAARGAGQVEGRHWENLSPEERGGDGRVQREGFKYLCLLLPPSCRRRKHRTSRLRDSGSGGQVSRPLPSHPDVHSVS